jgi:hypothetical protein
MPCARAHPVRAGLPGYQSALRALALEGTPSHGRGRRARSPGAPREGEGRRTEWRSAAQRELHGGCDRIGQRAEAEKFITRATVFADARLKSVQRPVPPSDLDTTSAAITEGAHRRLGIGVASCSDLRKGAEVSTKSAGAASWGREERSRAGSSSVLAQWRQPKANGRRSEERAQVAARVPDGPDLHEGAPKQRSAARFRGGRKSAQLPRRRLPVFTSWRTTYVAQIGVEG